MKILVLLLLAAGCSLAADMQIVSDFQEENVRYRALIGKVSKSEFVTLALEFLKSKETTDKQGRTRLSRTSENNRAF